jgi:bifunctional DNA-binding transcriptional regulator/antitoxin component of YhaV-PrlF toxin-antitoxin module
MKLTGHVQKLNYNRHITIPEDVLRSIKAKELSSFEIYTDRDCIILKKYDDSLNSELDYFHNRIKEEMDLDSPEYLDIKKKLKEIRRILNK